MVYPVFYCPDDGTLCITHCPAKSGFIFFLNSVDPDQLASEGAI